MSDRSFAIEANGRIDKRALRTRELLADALLSLGAQGPFEEFDVGALVDEAGISRSTFYQHFASKDDFLVRSWVDLLGATQHAYDQRYPENADILPSRPIFVHVGEARDFVASLVRSGIYARQMAAGEARLRAIAEDKLRKQKPHWSAERRRETAVYIAGGFVGLLRWWMESGLVKPAVDVQGAFERLTANALRD